MHLYQDAVRVEYRRGTMDSLFSSTLNTVAPLRLRKIKEKSPTPWYNEHTHALKRAAGKMERSWRKTKLFRVEPKMAPLCLACRLSLCLLWTLLSFLCFLVTNTWSTTFVYDRQALLEIRNSVSNMDNNLRSDFYSHYSPFQMSNPDHLCRRPIVYLRKKCRRRRGKRGGVASRLKAGLDISDGRYRQRWIRPIVPSSFDVPMLCPPPRFRRSGVHPQLLRQLNKRPQTASDPPSLRMALLNVRSVVNKAFILHDFFISCELDFMFMTKTWTKEGDFNPFSELALQNCSFFSSPRLSKHGEVWQLFF